MKKLKYALPVLLLLWIALIFLHSLQPASVSGTESKWWLAILKQLGAAGLTEHRLRKIAHFAEFAILGILAGLLMGKNCRVWWAALLFSLSVGLLVAVCDETIQLFVEGRSGQIFDVWLDFAGATAGAAITTILLHLFSKRRK